MELVASGLRGEGGDVPIPWVHRELVVSTAFV